MKHQFRHMLPHRLSMVLGLRYRENSPIPLIDKPEELPAEVVDLRTGPYLAALRSLKS